MLAYYYRNPDKTLSKLVDEEESYEDITTIIKELTEKHKTPVIAYIRRGN